MFRAVVRPSSASMRQWWVGCHNHLSICICNADVLSISIYNALFKIMLLHFVRGALQMFYTHESRVVNMKGRGLIKYILYIIFIIFFKFFMLFPDVFYSAKYGNNVLAKGFVWKSVDKDSVDELTRFHANFFWWVWKNIFPCKVEIFYFLRSIDEICWWGNKELT